MKWLTYGYRIMIPDGRSLLVWLLRCVGWNKRETAKKIWWSTQRHKHWVFYILFYFCDWIIMCVFFPVFGLLFLKPRVRVSLCAPRLMLGPNPIAHLWGAQLMPEEQSSGWTCSIAPERVWIWDLRREQIPKAFSIVKKMFKCSAHCYER